jgi:hypothetical protein
VQLVQLAEDKSSTHAKAFAAEPCRPLKAHQKKIQEIASARRVYAD